MMFICLLKLPMVLFLTEYLGLLVPHVMGQDILPPKYSLFRESKISSRVWYFPSVFTVVFLGDDFLIRCLFCLRNFLKRGVFPFLRLRKFAISAITSSPASRNILWSL